MKIQHHKIEISIAANIFVDRVAMSVIQFSTGEAPPTHSNNPSKSRIIDESHGDR
jgi:hypothetical protein